MNSLNKTIFTIAAFSVAMGFMEGAVVIYLRDIYYPNGFAFPMVPISRMHSTVELMREAATLIMLVAAGWLAGNTPIRRFAFFLLSFAIWDLIYYLVLKMVLDWPSSLLEWDILFLIPVPWFGPVIAPCLISLLMILLAVVLLRAPAVTGNKIIGKSNWFLLIGGSITVISSFILEYISYVAFVLDTNGTTGNEELLLQELSKFVPEHFNWLVFTAGFLMILSGIIRIHLSVSRLDIRSSDRLTITSSV